MTLYPSLKKLPKVVPDPREEQAYVPPGMVRVSTYNRRVFKESFKKAK